MTGPTTATTCPAAATQSAQQGTGKSEWTFVSWHKETYEKLASKIGSFFGRAVAVAVSVVSFIPSLFVDLGYAAKSLYDRKIARPQMAVPSQIPAQPRASEVEALKVQLAAKEQSVQDKNQQIEQLEETISAVQSEFREQLADKDFHKDFLIERLDECQVADLIEKEELERRLDRYAADRARAVNEISGLKEQINKLEQVNAELDKQRIMQVQHLTTALAQERAKTKSPELLEMLSCETESSVTSGSERTITGDDDAFEDSPDSFEIVNLNDDNSEKEGDTV